MKMIIGLTGKNAAGKTTAAEILKKHGFRYCSLSDMIRMEADKRQLEHSRENLIGIGNELRQRFGPGVWAHKLSEEGAFDDNLIVDSIRHPDEARILKASAALRKIPFFLIAVRAGPKLRYERSKARGRVGDGQTYEDFIRLEKQEDSDDENSQQLTNTEKMADLFLDNDSSLESLKDKIDAFLAEHDDKKE